MNSGPAWLPAGEGEVRDGFRLQGVVDRNSPFERLAELLSSPRGQSVEVGAYCGSGKGGPELGRGVEAQGQLLSRDSNLVEVRVLQKLPKPIGVRHAPGAISVAIGEFVAGYFSDGAFERCKWR
jgi:hypothetical protein